MKKIILVLILSILVMGLASAFEFDNVKTYDTADKTVTVKNAFGLGDTLFKGELTTPQSYPVVMGKDRLVGEINITTLDTSLTFKEIFNDMYFVNMKTGEQMAKDYRYKIKVLDGVREIPITELECGEIIKGEKEPTDCPIKITGYRYEDIYSWNEIKDVSDIPKGEFTLGIFTDVEPNEYGDWVIKVYGQTVPEWATWNDTFQTNLKAVWNFEETSGTNAADALDGNNNGTINAGVTLNQEGKFNKAFNFSASTNSNKVLVADHADLRDASITVNAWVRPSETFGNNRGILAKGGDTAGGYYIRGSGANVQCGGRFSGGGGFSGSGGAGWIANNWTMITGVFDTSAGTCTVYVNGASVATSGSGALANDVTSAVYIGADDWATTEAWNGTIDEVYLWKEAKGVSFISSLYSSYNGTFFGNNVTVGDNEYPQFYNSSFTPANGTQFFNMTAFQFMTNINNTNGTAFLGFGNANYSLANLSTTFFNVTLRGLSAGTYSYYFGAYGNGSSHNFNKTQTLQYTISKNVTTMKLYIDGNNGDTVKAINTLVWLNGTLINGDYDDGINLTVGGVQQNFSLTSPVIFQYNTASPPRTVVVNATYVGDANYTVSTESWNLIISNTLDIPVLSNFRSNPTAPVQYSPSQSYLFNVTVTDSANNQQAVIFELNNVNYTASNSTSTEFFVTIPPLPANTYTYRWFANDTVGGSNTSLGINYNITQNTTYSLALGLSPSSSVTYPTTTTATGSGCPSDLVCTLYRDSVSKVNPEAIILGAGTYNYTYNSSANNNYTSKSASQLLTVSKATGTVNTYINGSRSNQNFINGSNILLAANLTSGQFGIINMTINGTQFAYNASTNISRFFQFNNTGVFNVSTQYYGNSNYTGFNESWIVTISTIATGGSVTLNYPTAGLNFSSNSLTFNYSINNPNGNTIENTTLYIWNNDNSLNQKVFHDFRSSAGTLCYQETANASNARDGNCGLYYSGSYIFTNHSSSGKNSSFSGSSQANIIDGDYSTFGAISRTGIGAPTKAFVLINYTKPASASNSSLWRIKASDNSGGILADLNNTVPAGCFNIGNQLYLNLSSISDDLGNSYVAASCFDGTTWQSVWQSSSSFAGSNIYDEAMIWNISVPTDTQVNVSYFNNTLNEGRYNWSADASFSQGGTFTYFINGNYSFNIGIGINNVTYNASVLETSRQYFSVNYSRLTSILFSTATFYYNNTAYPSTVTCSQNNCLAENSLDVDLVYSGTNQNNSFYWTINTYNGTSLTQTNTSVYNQSTYYIAATYCSSGDIALNYTAYDEQNRTRLKPYSFDGEFQYYVGHGTVYRTLNISNKETNEVDVCVAPTTFGGQNTRFYYNSIIAYNAPNASVPYVTRNHFDQNTPMNSTMQQIPLYLLKSSSSTSFILQVQDRYLQPVSSVLVNAQKCYNGLAQNETVFISRTDANGLTVGNFEAETALYQFLITNHSETLLEVIPCSPVVPQTTPYTLLFQLGVNYNSPFLDIDNATDINSTLVFNKTSGVVTFTYEDTSGEFTGAEVIVRSMNYSGNVQPIVCRDTLNISSGRITCTVPAGGTYTIAAYVHRTTQALVDQIIATYETFSSTIGIYGVFLGFFLILICAFIFKFNEIAGIWMVNAAVIFCNMIGLIAFGNVFITAMIAISIIITVVLER